MDTDDLWVFEAIGERGTQLTGYPCVSVYHHFRYHPKEVITGVFDDWLYEHKGIFAYTVELWDLPTAAGIEAKSEGQEVHRLVPQASRRGRLQDPGLRERARAGRSGAVARVRPSRSWARSSWAAGTASTPGATRRPPCWRPRSRPRPISPSRSQSLAPRIAWREVTLTPLGDGVYHLLAVVENRGFLPTSGSNQAAKIKAVRPVRLELELPAGATLRSGKPKQEIGHLEGRSNKLDVAYYGVSPTDNRGKAEWLIHAPAGGTLTLCAVAERGGTLRRQIVLG